MLEVDIVEKLTGNVFWKTDVPFNVITNSIALSYSDLLFPLIESREK